MFAKKTIEDVNIKGETILLRTDYNVPMENGEVLSDLRIRASLPTINYLLEHEAKKIIILSHLGRPEGQKNQDFSLSKVAETLAGLLPGRSVNFVDDVSGPEVEAAVESLPSGAILLLENLRFSPAEEANSEDYAREIIDSTHATLFVQDGFAVVHRAHASTDAITHFLPSVAGLLLKKEITALSKVLQDPKRPLTLVLGGAKVEDKKPLIHKFADFADHICVGGKIASEASDEIATFAPADKMFISEDFDEDAAGNKLDVGPFSTAKIIEIVTDSKTVVWNGLLGKAEDPAFATSSTILAKTLGENPAIFSVICGGDTSGFVESLQEEYPELKYGLVSTGGGAALEFLCGEALPGYEALNS